MDNATLNIADSIKGIISTFTSESENLLKQGLLNLQKYIPQYQSLMDSLTFNPATGTGSNAALAGSGGTVVNINDSGDKIFNTNEEAIDYTHELVNAAKDATRSGG
jgi:hypothetical protein